MCGHSDDRVRFHIWGLDTNNSVKELDAMVPGGNMYAKALLPNNTLSVGKWGFLYFDQLMWYWNTSCLAEKEHGGKIWMRSGGDKNGVTVYIRLKKYILED